MIARSAAHQIKYYGLAVSGWGFTRAGPKAVVRLARRCSIRELAFADEASEPHHTPRSGLPPIIIRRPATLTGSSICEFSAESTLGTADGTSATKMGASAKIRCSG